MIVVQECEYDPGTGDYVPIIWLKDGDCESFIMGLEVDCSLFVLARPYDIIDPVTYIFGGCT